LFTIYRLHTCSSHFHDVVVWSSTDLQTLAC